MWDKSGSSLHRHLTMPFLATGAGRSVEIPVNLQDHYHLAKEGPSSVILCLGDSSLERLAFLA